MLDGSPGGNVTPPLVTLVLINWNYASYVGAAIASIKAQDYPAIDVLVVDNGSTDTSLEVIEGAVGGDSRFRVIRLAKNLGQLGALFRVTDEFRGEFVTVVDADDVLQPNFVSRHAQVHIALPQAVAFTSSNIREINADGTVISNGYGPFGVVPKVRSRPLADVDSVPHLATISACDYQRLVETTSTVPHFQRGWCWGPGTSNMYRRSMLNVVRQERGDAPYFRAADSYLNPLCHALAGSALIYQTLSEYRIHRSNYYAARESFTGMRTGHPEMDDINKAIHAETIEFILRNSRRFVGLVGKSRFWDLIDHIALEPRSRTAFRHPGVQAALVTAFAPLVEDFGEDGLYDHLIPRMRIRALRAITQKAYGGQVPARLRLRLLRTLARGRLARWRKRLQTAAGHTQPAPRTPPQASSAAAAESVRAEPPTLARERAEIIERFGPAALLSRSPPIFKTSIAHGQYLGIAPAFGARFGDVPAGFIVYPTWTVEDTNLVAIIARAVAEHRRRYPNHRLICLCNTRREAELLTVSGVPALHLNKNFTVSDTIFRPLPNVSVEFDAIYNARFVPSKRHQLAAATPNVAYLAFAEGSPARLEDHRLLLAAAVADNPTHVLLNPQANGLPERLSPGQVNAHLNRAAVGLCLSAAEGSNCASMEYMLAGLPVVSTPSSGGRDVYFEEEYCVICEPTAGAVRDAVAALKARKIPREYVRARTLAKIEPDRRRFLTLVDDLLSSLGGERRFEGPWPFGETSGLVAWDSFDRHLKRLDPNHPHSGLKMRSPR